jgi:hypothetical protein
VVECLPDKHKALSSQREKKRERERERERSEGEERDGIVTNSTDTNSIFVWRLFQVL